MTTRSSNSAGRGVSGRHPVTTQATQNPRRCGLRYRLVVVAPDPVKVIRNAGGWLFDQTMAGWDVYVLLGDSSNSRPLRILGARAVNLERSLGPSVRAPSPQALAVDADLYRYDNRIRDWVAATLSSGFTDVRMWSEKWAADNDNDGELVRHRLSAAARAFKSHALAAAVGAAGSIKQTEVFRTSSLCQG